MGVVRPRGLAFAAMSLLMVLIVGCETGFETSDLRTGMAEREVVELMGPPARRAEFPMPGDPATRFAVLEYPLVDRGAWTPTPHWLLFDPNGLVTFGPGGATEARLRTAEAYYDWMAANGKMPRAAAERHVQAAFRQAYGASLNPAVDSYLQYRVEVMQGVDEGRLSLGQAEQAIREKYAELRGGLDLFDLSDPPPEGLERAMAVAGLGATTTAAPSQPSHPKAARRRTAACPAAPQGSARVLRCF